MSSGFSKSGSTVAEALRIACKISQVVFEKILCALVSHFYREIVFYCSTFIRCNYGDVMIAMMMVLIIWWENYDDDDLVMI